MHSKLAKEQEKKTNIKGVALCFIAYHSSSFAFQKSYWSYRFIKRFSQLLRLGPDVLGTALRAAETQLSLVS